MSGLTECYCGCYGTKWKHKHIPLEGEFLVRNGKVYPVIEMSFSGGDDESVEYTVYTEVDENGDEVEL